MAFGQASGPPANARRVAELAALLEERGYDSFREARHPFDLTQRQAAGKFTTAEVDELMDRLQEVDDAPAPDGGEGGETPDQRRRRERDEEIAVRLDADVMATELVNRGWCCIRPPETGATEKA
ncbi:MAG TPA: hypothetical protein VIT24_09735 [Acidimicrobiales bacterium]